MARHVFAADRRPNWQRAEKLITALVTEELDRAGSACEVRRPGAVRGSLSAACTACTPSGTQPSSWSGGVISADTTGVGRGSQMALSDFGPGQAVGPKGHAG